MKFINNALYICAGIVSLSIFSQDDESYKLGILYNQVENFAEGLHNQLAKKTFETKFSQLQKNINNITGSSTKPWAYSPSKDSTTISLTGGGVSFTGYVLPKDASEEFDPSQRIFYLENIGLRLPYQKKGIGSLILNFLLDKDVALYDGYDAVVATAVTPDSIKLFNKFGFKELSPSNFIKKISDHEASKIS